MNEKTALVIQIYVGNKNAPSTRFFSSFGKNKRLSTAWSLAGAKLFMKHGDQTIEKIKKTLEQKKVRYSIAHVELFPF